jgi:hypothetical protein
VKTIHLTEKPEESLSELTTSDLLKASEMVLQ